MSALELGQPVRFVGPDRKGIPISEGQLFTYVRHDEDGDVMIRSDATGLTWWCSRSDLKPLDDVLEELAQQASAVPTCPHLCGPLQWADDQWICPKCGDEWDENVGQSPSTPDTAPEAVHGDPAGSSVSFRLSFSDECDGDAQAMVAEAIAGWNIRINGDEAQVWEVTSDGLVCVPPGDTDPLASKLFTWEEIDEIHVH